MGQETPIGRIVRANTITDAWYRGLNIIWNHGKVITDERGSKIKEFMNLMVTIKDPYKDEIPADIAWNKERLDEYAKQLITGENSQDFEYTYGQRLRNWDNQVDQIDYAIRKLKSSQSTRRATAVTWIPYVDTEVDEVPCMILDDFKVRDGKVHLTTLFRSHDFAGAYPANLYGLSRLLKYVADESGYEPGTITTISVSAHVYEHDWDKIEKIVTEI
ncbi:thymidylate synthase [Methanohalophilus levihalophilus]|uniref:thymidylate synthase n=1 Tax=Methanohalophilus levihalophilus TaxID=1431282 RepID=UPI001AE3E549|nr:thymidylate synthase [Methanohalophilus levihalophilus]MBP2030524.1 thymidylate synthase [Methanohalophilus levihalophilus]